MRCFYCLRKGRTMPFCSQPAHLNLELGESCTNNLSCTNCTDRKYPNNNHHARGKVCPVLITYKEIQAIKAIQKVNSRDDWTIYETRHQHDGSLYSTMASPNHDKPQQKAAKTSTTDFTPPPTTTTKQQDTTDNKKNGADQPSGSNIRPSIKYESEEEMATASDTSQPPTTISLISLLKSTLTNYPKEKKNS